MRQVSTEEINDELSFRKKLFDMIEEKLEIAKDKFNDYTEQKVKEAYQEGFAQGFEKGFDVGCNS